MKDTSQIAVWLVEDHTGFRNTFSYLLDHTTGMHCTGAFGRCETALSEAEIAEPPDVIVLDINLPEMDGITGISALKVHFPDVPIVMLTINDDKELIFKALKAGASGYLLKSAPVDQTIAAIREAYHGGTLMPAPVAQKVLKFFQPIATPSDYDLSERELEVIECMAAGLSYKEIAARMHLSVHTINNHLRHIYAKLHVRSGIEAVAKAIREQLI